MSRNKLVTQKFSKSKKIFVIFHWWNYDIKDWLVYFFIRYNHDSWKRRQINFSCPNSSNNMIGFFSRFSTWNTHNLYQVGITRQRTIFQQSKVLLYLNTSPTSVFHNSSYWVENYGKKKGFLVFNNSQITALLYYFRMIFI